MISAISVVIFPVCSNRIQPLYGTRYVQRNQVISKEIGELKSRRIYAAKRSCECFDLHKEYVPYKHAWSWQKSVVHERLCLINKGEDQSDTLIVLQHPPVYTLGTGSSDKFLNFEIENAPYDIYRTERGGEVTYHGPGQLVMYPIINLRHHKQDLDWYLRSLEEVVIRALWSTFSIKATRINGLTGVWVGNQKIAAIGIKVSKWVTYHGLALNVTTDLTPFDHITPCGIQDRGVGSISKILKDSSYGTKHSETVLLDDTYESLLREFSEVFQVSIERSTSICLDAVGQILQIFGSKICLKQSN